MANKVPSGKLTQLLKMAIYSEFSHEKLLFSIAMLNYLMVNLPLLPAPTIGLDCSDLGEFQGDQ